jgi:hypothetical protein
MDTSRRLTETIEAFLRKHRSEMAPRHDPALAALVIETAIEALAHKAVIERRDLLQGGIFERETMRLITNYLIDR